MDDQNIIGKTIRLLRKRAGYTQKDLADRIGISDKAVSKWERGLGLPEISYLRKLSILLDTDTDSLLSGGIQQDVKWQGIICLEPNKHGINVNTVIYDKPLINILLSYFILVGIQEILVVCPELDEDSKKQLTENGNTLGLNVIVFIGELKDINITTYISANYIMLLYKFCFLYGVEQTRFFQRAMTHRDHLTTLLLPRKRNKSGMSIHVDSSMRIINSNAAEPIRKRYDYSILPFLFFPATMLESIIDAKYPCVFMTKCINHGEVYVEMMDRGFIEVDIDDWNDVQDAAAFLRIVQDRCGMNVYCVEEVAWRRGFISLEQLRILGERYSGSEYGAYICSLCDHLQ